MVKKCFLGVVILLLLVFISLLGIGFWPTFKAYLIGEETVNIEVFEDYQEQGVYGCYGSKILGCKKKPNVEVINKVDNKKLGEYEIIYKVKYKNKEIELKRKVNVVDTTPPSINLDSEEILVCPNKDDSLEYQASDNYDGDLTSKVEKIKDGNVIRLKVKDSSNNEVEKIVTINYQDNEKPTISLKGEKTVYLYKGNSYKEAGYSASDNCNGDLTNKVEVTNNVNVNETGNYTVTYKVKDEANNEAVVTRTVKVIENKTTDVKGNKIIYLTFDDGPGYYTDELLNILKQYNVKATFFVTWQHPGYASSIKRAYEEGHTIGLHTYSHVYSQVYASMDAYFKDLEAINTQVKNLIRIDSKLIRFPGGSSNTVSRITPKIMTNLAYEVQARGYQYFDWNVSSGDTSTSNSTVIANNVINSLGNGVYVVLQHDTKQASVKAVKTIIEYGLSHGYTFLPLDENSYPAHHRINN